MNLSWLRPWKGQLQQSAHGKRQPRRPLAHFRLTLESLESRTLLSTTFTWNGGGGDNNWMTGANWVGGTAPTSGSNLIFDGSTQTTTNNNFTGFSFNSITFASTGGAFTLNGNSINLAAGITDNRPGLGNQSINLASITLTGNQTWTNINSNSTIYDAAPVALGSNNLTTNATAIMFLAGNLTGSGQLTAAGGQVNLTGDNSSFTGPVAINNGGTVAALVDNALGTAAGATTVASGGLLVMQPSGGTYTNLEPIILQGGTFSTDTPTNFSGPFTVTAAGSVINDAFGTTTLGGTINMGTFGLAAEPNGSTLTLNGIISGNSALTTSSGGLLVLGAANTYTGGTTVNAGTLLVNSGGSIGDVTVKSSATLEGTGTVGAITASGGTVAPGTASTKGILTAASADFSGGGTLQIRVTGYTTAGTDFDKLNLGSGALTAGGTSKLNLNLAGDTTSGTATGVVTSGSLNGVFTTVTVNPSADQATPTYTGTSLDVGTIITPTFTWNGGGGDNNWMTGANWVGGTAPTSGSNLIFDGSTQTNTNNNFTGFSFNSITFATTAGAFTLNGNAINLFAGITDNRPVIGNQFINLAGITLTGSQTWTNINSNSTINDAAPVALGTNNLTTNATGVMFLAGSLTGSGQLTAAGGQVNLTGDNSSFAGPVAINNGGTVAALVNNALGTAVGATTVASGGLLVMQPNGGTYTNLEPITLQGGTFFTDTTTNFSGPITVTASGSVIESIGGTTTLGGTINMGTFGLLAEPSNLTLNLTLNGIISGNSALTISNGGGPGSTLVLGAANTYMGGTFVTNTTVQVGNAQAFGSGSVNLTAATLQSSGSALSIGNAFTLTNSGSVGVTLGGSNNLTFTGVIGGSGSLTQTDTATVELDNIDTYSGGTTVNAGTLFVKSGGSIGAVTVNSTGTLEGTGTVGAITASGGTVAPGTASTKGILTAASAKFSSGGILQIRVTGYGIAGTDFDQLNLGNGALTAGGSSTLNLDLTGDTIAGTAPGVVILGSRTGVFTNVTVNPSFDQATPLYTGPGGPITTSRVSVTVSQPGPIGPTGDFDGDGKADLAVWRPSDGTWHILLSATNQVKNVQWGLPGDIPISNSDFDGDGKTDIAVWRPSNGTWYVLTSSSGFTTQLTGSNGIPWGLPGDIPIQHSDFDGDGKADLAVWRPSNGTWYVLTSSSGYKTQLTASNGIQWGLPGDIPLQHSDFDGDGKADIGVWRPKDSSKGGLSAWYVLTSSSGFTTQLTGSNGIQWGLPGDIPIQHSDFDGDHKADLVVWRPKDSSKGGLSAWYVLTSSSGFTTQLTGSNGIQWGLPGDIPLQDSDFDGDHKADMAVWRPSNGTWYVLTSSSVYTANITKQWGFLGDIPVQSSDFDKDGATDMAVWRPSDGTWYILTSFSSFKSNLTRQLGAVGDYVV